MAESKKRTPPPEPAPVIHSDTRLYKYETKVKYAEKEIIEFPDFSVKYLGIREVTYPDYPKRVFKEHVFEVLYDKESKKIYWGPGLGEISPVAFTVKGKEYILEMASSTALKCQKIEEGYFIIWEAPEYHKLVDEYLRKIND